MQAFRTFLGETDMLAYLAMMAPRLGSDSDASWKPTGSIYLHCGESAASHYLKMLMDAIFGPGQFRNGDRLETCGAQQCRPVRAGS